MKIESIIKRRTQRFVKDNKVITKNKSEFIEIKLIICENIETKLFYRLLKLNESYKIYQNVIDKYILKW